MLKKRRRVALLFACVALCVAVVGGNVGQAQARRGKTIALQETAVLRLTNNDVNVHEASGSASGTFDNIRVHLRINVEDASKMTAQFSTNGSRGGLTGIGVANYNVSGSILRFSGTSRITGGSGAYTNARGHGIRIEGVMNRLKETLTMSFNGNMSY